MFKFIASAVAAATILLATTPGAAMADVHILYVKASFSTSQKRDRAVQQVTNYIAANVNPGDLFIPAQIAPYDGAYKGWPNAMTTELRFVDAALAKRDTLWNQLDAYLTSAANAPDKSLGERWDQKLDAANPDADTTKYNDLIKTWP